MEGSVWVAGFLFLSTNILCCYDVLRVLYLIRRVHLNIWGGTPTLRCSVGSVWSEIILCFVMSPRVLLLIRRQFLRSGGCDYRWYPVNPIGLLKIFLPSLLVLQPDVESLSLCEYARED